MATHSVVLHAGVAFVGNGQLSALISTTYKDCTLGVLGLGQRVLGLGHTLLCAGKLFASKMHSKKKLA